MRFIRSILALSLSFTLGASALSAAVSDEELGKFVADQADQGVTGTALADAVIAKAGKADAHAKPGAAHDAAAPAADGDAGPDYRGLGHFVQDELAAGLRGQALADAIHAELKARHIGNGHGDPGGADHGNTHDAGGHSHAAAGAGNAGAGGAAHGVGHGR